MSPLTQTPNLPPSPRPVPPQQPGPPAPQAPLVAPNRTRNLWLAIGIPVGVILLFLIIAAAILAWFSFSPANAVDTNATLTDATSVSVNAPNATLDFLPSTDDQVHVTMTGTHTGPAPTLTTQVKDGVAEVNADCPRFWFFTAPCDLTLAVTLPENLDVTANGINGQITVNDLSGDIRLETTNGSIDAIGTSGGLDLVTVNGRVTVQDAASETVTAKTVNGTVELNFRAAPSDVTATSVNGAIQVQVPDAGARYAVTATTVLGKIDTGKMATDPAARRTITAETVNGSITVDTDK